MAQESTTVWLQAAARSPSTDCGGCQASPVAPACGAQAFGEPCLTPRLEGDSGTLQRVLAALDAEAADADGGIVARHCVKSLRIADGEAELTVTFAPTCGRGKVLAEIAFATLRRLLPETDVYVRHAV